MSGVSEPTPRVAVVDYGLGNLFSVGQACAHARMEPVITSDAAEIVAADAVILPGVGAFGDAMESLRRLDLVGAIRDLVAADRPVIGLCLGQQLLLTGSEEFGEHEGLGVIGGVVKRFPAGMHEGTRPHPLKVPQIGWNGLYPGVVADDGPPPEAWDGTPLEGLNTGEHVYFVHSFHVVLDDPSHALAWTTYGDLTYCSALAAGNVVAFQFHPERSGPAGLRIYRNLGDSLRQRLSAGV